MCTRMLPLRVAVGPCVWVCVWGCCCVRAFCCLACVCIVWVRHFYLCLALGHRVAQVRHRAAGFVKECPPAARGRGTNRGRGVVGLVSWWFGWLVVWWWW